LNRCQFSTPVAPTLWSDIVLTLFFKEALKRFFTSGGNPTNEDLKQKGELVNLWR